MMMIRMIPSYQLKQHHQVPKFTSVIMSYMWNNRSTTMIIKNKMMIQQQQRQLQLRKNNTLLLLQPSKYNYCYSLRTKTTTQQSFPITTTTTTNLLTNHMMIGRLRIMELHKQQYIIKYNNYNHIICNSSNHHHQRQVYTTPRYFLFQQQQQQQQRNTTTFVIFSSSSNNNNNNTTSKYTRLLQQHPMIYPTTIYNNSNLITVFGTQNHHHYFSSSNKNSGPSRFPQVNRNSKNNNSSSNSNRFSFFTNSNTTSRLANGVGMIGAASILFGKTKYILAAMKVTKLASLGSMILSIGAYSMLFGWPYAIGVVGLIFCHECGHLIMMLKLGKEFSPMVFIPFMGAVIAMKDQPRDAWEDAIIAAGGPIAGTMASCAVAIAANATDSQLLYALADFGFMINLINLLPIGSLDGGRWAGALSKYVGVAGTGLGGYLAYTGMIANPLFYIIILAGAYETFQRFYDPFHLPPNYYRISNTRRALLTGGYFGSIAFLIYAMDKNNRRQKPPDVIAREQGNEPYWDTSGPF